jgi:hypothetical protein
VGHEWTKQSDHNGTKYFECMNCGRIAEINYGPDYCVFLPVDVVYGILEKTGKWLNHETFTCEEIMAYRVMLE